MHFYELFFMAPQLLARHRDNQISRCHEIFQKPCVVSGVSLQNGKLFAWYQLTGNLELTAVKESVHKWILPEATVCTVFVWFQQLLFVLNIEHGCFSRIRCTELSLKAME